MIPLYALHSLRTSVSFEPYGDAIAVGISDVPEPDVATGRRDIHNR